MNWVPLQTLTLLNLDTITMTITSMVRNTICWKYEVAYKYMPIHSFCNPSHANIRRLDKSIMLSYTPFPFHSYFKTSTWFSITGFKTVSTGQWNAFRDRWSAWKVLMCYCEWDNLVYCITLWQCHYAYTIKGTSRKQQ